MMRESRCETANPTCLLCGTPDCPIRASADENAVRGAGFFYRLHQCSECGLQFIHPQPAPAALEKLYGEGFYSEAKRDDLISRLFARYEQLCYWDRFRIFRRQPDNLKLLDVGSGNGHFLAFMRRRGWQVSGVEWSRAGVEIARRQFDIDVFQGPVEDAAFPASHFDVVTLWHVLEHLPDPLETGKEIYRILKPGGTIVVAVPNVESFEAVYFKEKWALLDLPRHLYGFSPRTIELLLHAAGLEVTRVEHFSLEYSVSLATLDLLNLVGERNFMYELVKKRRRYAPEGSPRLLRNMCANIAFVPLALPMAMMIAAWSWLVRRGTSIAVVAHKPDVALRSRAVGAGKSQNV